MELSLEGRNVQSEVREEKESSKRGRPTTCLGYEKAGGVRGAGG